jgi:hypothetical protein
MIRITKNTKDQVTFEKDTSKETWFDNDCSDANLLKQCNRENDTIARVQFDDGKYIGSILYVYFKTEVMVRYPEIGKQYKHYKGGRYEVISLAKHSETDEVLVIYKSLHFGSVYARPLSMWFDTVIAENAVKVTRFTLCHDGK